MSSLHRLKDLAVSESGFVFDPYSGGTFTLNRTGLAILHALGDGLGVSQIARRLQSSFQVSGADVEADVRDFVRQLIAHYLLAGDFQLEEGNQAPSSERAEVGDKS